MRLNRPCIRSPCHCISSQPTTCISMQLMCVSGLLLASTSRNMPHQPIVASLGNLPHAIFAAHVRTKPSLGMHTSQHASPACCSASRQPAAHSLCSLCVCQALFWPAHLTTCPHKPVVCICRPLLLLKHTSQPCSSVPITSRSCPCWGNLLLHPSCIYYNSLPCPCPLLDAVTSHSIVPMTPHLRAQGIAPLCQASSIPSESASLLLHCYASSKSILVLQQAKTFHPWLTKLSYCTRHCTLVPPCLCHRLLMRLRCCPMKPWCPMLHVEGLTVDLFLWKTWTRQTSMWLTFSYKKISQVSILVTV